MMPSRIRSIALALALTAFAPSTAASQISEVTPGESTEPESQIRTLPPAYEDEMMRLAEILGALHYLRALCDAEEGTLWRDQMRRLLEKEAPTADRRARLTARFNRGYRGYAEIHRECTPAAAEAANRYRRQGIRLAAEIPDRYGN